MVRSPVEITSRSSAAWVPALVPVIVALVALATSAPEPAPGARAAVLPPDDRLTDASRAPSPPPEHAAAPTVRIATTAIAPAHLLVVLMPVRRPAPAAGSGQVVRSSPKAVWSAA